MQFQFLITTLRTMSCERLILLSAPISYQFSCYLNDVKFFMFIANVSHETVIFLQVALNLLSEKEKNDQNQLVSKMVSYSITYKNVKTNSQQSDLGNEAISDLAFDPPIADFINFKVWVAGVLLLFQNALMLLILSDTNYYK